MIMHLFIADVMRKVFEQSDSSASLVLNITAFRARGLELWNIIGKH